MARRDRRLLRYARELRRNPTWDEFRLWQQLRGERVGHRFRRQEQVGPYIVDFVCLASHLIVEVDGLSHYNRGQAERDLTRDFYFVNQGYHVIHIDSDVIQKDLDWALEAIVTALARPSPGARYLR